MHGGDDVRPASSRVKLTYDDFLLFPDVVFTRFDVVEPDLLYLSHATAKQALTPAHVRGVPDLVIEIGSPSTRKRDETIKKRLYEREGVSEYWVVDPELDLIRVYVRGGERFGRA